MRNVLLAAIAAVTIGSGSLACADMERSGLVVPHGTYEVVALRRASDVAGQPDGGAANGLLGQEVSFGETLTWFDGMVCEEWRIEVAPGLFHNPEDPLLADVNLGSLDGPVSDGDQRIWETEKYMCGDNAVAEVTRVDDLVTLASASNGSLNVVLQKPLSTEQISQFQKKLKDMKFYSGDITGEMDQSTRFAVSLYAEYRSAGAKEETYRFADPVITENLLDGLGVLEDQGDHPAKDPATIRAGASE